jgi:hypothetical protein
MPARDRLTARGEAQAILAQRAEEEAFMRVLEPELDPGIKAAVRVLRRGGVETFESCEGGPGHCYPEPTVRFAGQAYEGFRALSVALLGKDEIGMRLYALRRVWTIEDGEPTGPKWELVFLPGPSRA